MKLLHWYWVIIVLILTLSNIATLFFLNGVFCAMVSYNERESVQRNIFILGLVFSSVPFFFSGGLFVLFSLLTTVEFFVTLNLLNKVPEPA